MIRAMPEIKRNFAIEVFPKLNPQIGGEKKSTFFIKHVKFVKNKTQC